MAQLFSEHLGIPLLDDIEAMARAARQALREKFLQADLGISGANFLVAEPGTLVIITNEGNGRLCTSAPRIHIGITGIEKIIPSLQDLAVFLRLLPRSATGQRMTSYINMVNGPRRAEDEDGPEEFHLVLVDNGRSRLLADPSLREALYCVRCEACLNICPVYQKVGGHAYGWVYPGPIGAVVSPMLVGLRQAKDLPQASTLCGAAGRSARSISIYPECCCTCATSWPRAPTLKLRPPPRRGKPEGARLRPADEQPEVALHCLQGWTEPAETLEIDPLRSYEKGRKVATAHFIRLDPVQGPARAAASHYPGNLAARPVPGR